MGFIRAYGLPALFLFLSGCSLEQPTALNRGTTFNHSEFTSSCSDCHTDKLPAADLKVPETGSGAKFIHATAYNGTKDCVNCHMAELKNLGVTWAGATYDHKNDLGTLLTVGGTCSECHDSARPSNTNDFVELNSATPFDYASHGSPLDCSECHASVSRFSVSADWRGGFYKHDAALTTCQSCHSTQRPSAIVNGFDHTTSGTGDCALCHLPSLNSDFNSLADWAGAENGPEDTADPTQDLSLSVATPTFTGTTVSSLSAKTVKLSQPMMHQSTQVGAALAADCADCHTGAAAAIFYPGVFHSILPARGTNQPTLCVDCHLQTKPIGFVGPVQTSRNPDSASMRHEAVGWAVNGSQVWVRGATALVSNECSTCHKSFSVWSGATYHGALTAAAKAQPTSCLDCHANSRPSGLVPVSPAVGVTPYDHATNGMGDCNTCHSSVSTWSGGKFHSLTNIQTTCNSCHNSQRPTTTAGFVAYDSTNKPFDTATHGGTLDCVTCHKNITSFNNKANWAGGFYTHAQSLTSCVECHSSQRPNVVVNGFSHANAGTGDCLGCHSVSLTNNVFTSMANWAGGINGTPTGRVGSMTKSMSAVQLNYTSGKVTSKTTVTDTILEQILHTSVQVTNTNLACVGCHPQANSGIYNNARFHNSLTTNGKAQPTACVDCHGGRAPANIVGPSIPGSSVSPMDHDATFTVGGAVVPTLDCSVCHLQPGAVWTGAQFHSKIGTRVPANCTTCHYVNMPLGPTLVNKMSHVSTLVTQDCISCHPQATTVQAANPTLAMWAGGLYHTKIAAQPTSKCTDCHTPDRPAGVTVSLNDNQKMNHKSASVGADCVPCHTSNGTSNVWSRSVLLHAYASTTTCNDCHGLTNGGGSVAGTNNDIPAGLTNSDTLSVSSVAAAGTYAKFTHLDVNAAGKQCNVCHTVVGMVGLKWKAASFHAKVPAMNMNGTTGRCDNCHMSEKPSVVVRGFSHASITTDCAGCHNFPGTGTTAAPNWLGASGADHSVFNTATDCYTCHSTKLPSATTAIGTGGTPNTKNGYVHSTSYAGPATGTPPHVNNCAPCHAVVKANLGVRWSGGFFGHLGNSITALRAVKAAACSPCHDTKEHHRGEDCTRSGCHVSALIRWPTPSATGNFGGSWGEP